MNLKIRVRRKRTITPLVPFLLFCVIIVFLVASVWPVMFLVGFGLTLLLASYVLYLEFGTYAPCRAYAALRRWWRWLKNPKRVMFTVLNFISTVPVGFGSLKPEVFRPRYQAAQARAARWHKAIFG